MGSKTHKIVMALNRKWSWIRLARDSVNMLTAFVGRLAVGVSAFLVMGTVERFAILAWFALAWGIWPMVDMYYHIVREAILNYGDEVVKHD